MPYMFMPPVVADVPTTVASRHPGNPLMRHFRPHLRGRTLLKIAGAYALYDMPSAEVVATATEVYVGGHMYEVSDATGAALIAAGYGLFASALLTENNLVLLTESGFPLLTEGASV